MVAYNYHSKFGKDFYGKKTSNEEIFKWKRKAILQSNVYTLKIKTNMKYNETKIN